MTEIKQRTSKVIDEALTPLGYTKRKNTWFLTQDETIRLVDLQKSQYGEKYYINLAIYLKNLGNLEYPPENLCHIRTRLEAIVSNKEDYESLLDGEKNENIDERMGKLSKLFHSSALPWLSIGNSEASLREAIRNDKLKNSLITIAAKNRLTAG